MYKVFIPLAALVFSFAASAAQPSVVHFESGSARANGVHPVKYKQHQHKKVWVPGHRSHGHWVRGHYIWR